jgi:hypothetical protein
MSHRVDTGHAITPNRWLSGQARTRLFWVFVGRVFVWFRRALEDDLGFASHQYEWLAAWTSLTLEPKSQ